MRPLKLRIQAFGSYVDEQILDFETALADAPFLLIHGVTGSGKTTILDAIVFALYGESSGDIREEQCCVPLQHRRIGRRRWSMYSRSGNVVTACCVLLPIFVCHAER